MSAPNQLQQNSIRNTLGTISNQGSTYLDQYEQVSATLTANAGGDTVGLVMQFHKMGDAVFLEVVGTANTGNGAGVASYVSPAAAVPAQYCPILQAIDLPVFSLQAGVRTQTLMSINTNGTITLLPIDAATFVAASRVGNAHVYYFTN